MEVGAAWDMDVADVLNASRTRRFSESAARNREGAQGGLGSEEFSA